jgi:hypothetical protein
VGDVVSSRFQNKGTYKATIVAVLPAESQFDYEIDWEDGDPADRRKKKSQIKKIDEKDEKGLSACKTSIDRLEFSKRHFLQGSYLVNVPGALTFVHCPQARCLLLIDLLSTAERDW